MATLVRRYPRGTMNKYKRALRITINFLEEELENQNYQDRDQHLDLIQQLRDWHDWITEPEPADQETTALRAIVNIATAALEN